jgi:acyl carrier protein
MSDIQTKLTTYIRKELSSGEIEIEADTSLAGVIDSTAIMELVVWIEGECGFDVEIDDITPDNFGSIHKIVAYIDRNKKKS